MELKNETQGRWPFIIILVLVFTGIIIYRVLYKPSHIEAHTGQADVCISNVPAPAEANEPDSLGPEQKQNLSTPDIVETAPRIEAISISSSGESGVFIRGNFAHEGDIVDGFKILKIYPDKVEYEKDGKTITGVFPPPKRDKTEVQQPVNSD